MGLEHAFYGILTIYRSVCGPYMVQMSDKISKNHWKRKKEKNSENHQTYKKSINSKKINYNCKIQ